MVEVLIETLLVGDKITKVTVNVLLTFLYFVTVIVQQIDFDDKRVIVGFGDYEENEINDGMFGVVVMAFNHRVLEIVLKRTGIVDGFFVSVLLVVIVVLLIPVLVDVI